MPINFIPNDPLAQNGPPMRQKSPLPNRAANRAGFNFIDVAPEGVFPPGTPEFLFWQCREAALLSINVWEELNGPMSLWSEAAPDRRRLNLIQDRGFRLNAFYDRDSLSFFHHTTGNKTTFSGASTDVVAHEFGHAALDILRPELFVTGVTETDAFHEAFGDCIALLVALFDQPTRRSLLTPASRLGNANFVEAIAEDLSDGVRRAPAPLGPQHAASAPRRSLNDFRFQLPTTLPEEGAPSVLTSEIHSFGRVFSGCFYDTVRNIFAAAPTQNEAALLRAARTAGTLLIAAASSAPEVPRFFQAVGRAMVLEDEAQNGGANRQAINDAFSRHNLALGSSAMLSPKAALLGGAPSLKARAKGPVINPATVRDLRARLGASARTKMSVSAVSIGGEKMAKAVHYREVPLGDLSARLQGVMAVTPEAVLIGSEGGKPAALSAIPDAGTSSDEVHTYVSTLLKHNQIDFGGGTRRASAASVGGTRAATTRRASAVPQEDVTLPATEMPTHIIVSRGGKKVLVRVRFTCRH